ncbi:MAG: WD40 repeat domain-containing protein [Gemmataceae bacterium]|nr:WD40 repeat domain-containing protein [Gemmataceae bacterium]MCI0738901.1 WD40 repeat domain-containing protein [Gemmataceae bacterium]
MTTQMRPFYLLGLLLCGLSIAYPEEIGNIPVIGVRNFSVSPDGQFLTTTTFDKVSSDITIIRVWRVQDQKWQIDIKYLTPVHHVTFSKDSKHVFMIRRAPDGPGTIAEWIDFRADKSVKSCNFDHPSQFGRIQVLDGDRFIAMAPALLKERDRVTVHDFESKKNTTITLPGATIEKILFSGDGKLVALLDSKTSEVSLWDPRTGELKRKLQAKPQTSGLFFPSDGKSLFTHGGGGERWDLQTGKVLSPVAGWALFSPDGRFSVHVDDWRIRNRKEPAALVFRSELPDFEELARIKFLPAEWPRKLLAVVPQHNVVLVHSLGGIHFFRIPKFKE